MKRSDTSLRSPYLGDTVHAHDLISPRWRKVLREIWGAKVRTLLVVLSIAVGVFAVGSIVGAQAILLRDMNNSFAATNPASALLGVEVFDDALVESVRRMPGVADAEGRSGVRLRVQIAPNDWRDLQIAAMPDYDDLRIEKIFPEQGAWPPPDRELLIERASLGFLNTTIGQSVLVETSDGKQYHLRVAGTAHDHNAPQADLAGVAFGYSTLDTLEWLGEARGMEDLRIVVAEHPHNKAYIHSVADAVRDKIEKGGHQVYWVYVPEPGRHPADEIISGVLVIMGGLGILSLFASGFLVVNTISALLAQHVRQIGLMKAVGARSGQLMGMYFGTVLIYGLLALLPAAPLGAVGAYFFTQFVAGLLNFDVTSFTIPPHVITLEVTVAVIVPLFAALWPIISGSRMTVQEAISSYGITEQKKQKGAGDAERVRRFSFSRISLPFSRPVLLSLRNTFRRKGRLALTLSTLTLGGAIFIAVLSVRDSLALTLDDFYQYWKFDAWIALSRSYRAQMLEREALRVPGVVAVESWAGGSARRVRSDATESEDIRLTAPPAETIMLRPTVLQGRWLLHDDENAIVVNTDLLKTENDIKVGDTLALKLDGETTDWRVVGVVRGLLSGPVVYANYPYFARLRGDVGQADWINIIGERRDQVSQQNLLTAVQDQYKRLGVQVSGSGTTSADRATIESQFAILVALLLVMAALLAVVGALGLMGTMSINVLERTREIGVMRAIGASNGAVMNIVTVEGVYVGMISWALGALLALPISQLLSHQVGMAFLQTPLSYTFSLIGALIWLVFVIVLACVASFLPAWNASRLTVRDVLAYE
jgi:putative ABC transport system permease protein